MKQIPVSVIITTKNEEKRIGACLDALGDFNDVWVVDSGSADATQDIALKREVRVENFIWSGAYPKKRQWCLEHLDLEYDWVFFVDADEIVPPELVQEIAALDWMAAGYFVRGDYEFEGQLLKHGLSNNKLALIDRRRVGFPEIDDISLEGMGEMEGHYQPVLKADGGSGLEQLKAGLVHQAYEDEGSWYERHMRYAMWEAGMNARNAWPVDPKPLRQLLKTMFRKLPFRGEIAFVHCYVFKLGFLDGRAGFWFALSRRAYYRMISDASKAME